MKLVNCIVVEDEIKEYVEHYATEISENTPLTISTLKKVFIKLSKNLSDQNPERCKEYIELYYTSKDFIEGRKAFLEKQKLEFQGE